MTINQLNLTDLSFLGSGSEVDGDLCVKEFVGTVLLRDAALTLS